MKKNLFILLISFSLFSFQQKGNAGNIPKSSNQIVIGEIDSIYSNILDESRKIWIHIPKSARMGNSQTKLPVLYLLDGASHFYSVTGMIRRLSLVDVLPKMIVVAILNTDRTRDFTPTHENIDFFSGDSIKYATGGGDKFLDFMEGELIPYIDKTYPAGQYKTFAGHSFGGLSVINALINKPHLFNNYIAIDPSLWWGNHVFLNHADSILTANNFDDRALYVAVANTMGSWMDIKTVEDDTTLTSAHIRSVLKFVNSTEKSKNGLNFNWKYYKDENHNSVPLIAEYDALHFLFQWLKFNNWDQMYNTSSDITAEELIKLPKLHFEEVSKRFGYNVFPPENSINNLGYHYLNNKMPDKAIAFFDLNVKNYPNSSNVFDSRGDFYLEQKDTVKALENFRKALELNDLNIYREKIEQLKLSIKN